GDITPEARTVGALVVEPTGLLPAGKRRPEAQPRFTHLDLGRNVAESRLGELRQVLQLARSGVVLPEQPARARHLRHRGLDLVLERLHAGGGDLPDHQLPVAIEY